MISRRDFLKIVGLTTFAGALTPSLLRETGASSSGKNSLPGIESWGLTTCTGCPGACGLRVKLVDGRPVRVDGNPLSPINRGKLCPVGLTELQQFYNPDRLRSPLIRKGPRGSDNFEKIGWQEAYKLLFSRLSELRSRSEPHKVAFLDGDFPGITKQIVKRFMDAYGSPNYIDLNPLIISNVSNAVLLTFGKRSLPAFDIRNAEIVLSFGAPILESWYVPVLTQKNFGFWRRERNIRGRFIYVGPRLGTTASKADEFIGIHPGTEGALALGMAHVIIKEGLYDKDFVNTHTHGFDEFRDLVLRKYHPDRISGITGVPVIEILKISREFAAGKPSIAIPMEDISHFSARLYDIMAIMALNALVGNINKEGGIYIFHHDYPDLPSPVVRDEISKRGHSKPSVLQADAMYPVDTHPLLPFMKCAVTGKPYPISILMMRETDPLYSYPATEDLLKAFESIPFVISFSRFLDETSMYADLILPDLSPFEKWEIAYMPKVETMLCIGIIKPVLKATDGTLSTSDLFLRLSKDIGGSVRSSLPWEDTHTTIRSLIKVLYDESRGSPYGSSSDEILERILEKAGLKFPFPPNFEDFWKEVEEKGGWWSFIHPGEETLRFFTPSGRFEFQSSILRSKLQHYGIRKNGKNRSSIDETISSLGVNAKGGELFLPHFEPLSEEGFHLITEPPLVFLTGRATNRPHLMDISGQYPRESWESFVEINPSTALRLGIKEGDLVVIETAKGRIKVPVKYNPGIHPKALFLPLGMGHRAYGRWAKDIGVNPVWIMSWNPDPLTGYPLKYIHGVSISKA